MRSEFAEHVRASPACITTVACSERERAATELQQSKSCLHHQRRLQRERELQQSCNRARLTIKLDRLIVLSLSSLLGWRARERERESVCEREERDRPRETEREKEKQKQKESERKRGGGGTDRKIRRRRERDTHT
jgi:hypothetical protein